MESWLCVSWFYQQKRFIRDFKLLFFWINQQGPYPSACPRATKTVRPGWHFLHWLRWYMLLSLKPPFSLGQYPPPLSSEWFLHLDKKITKHSLLPQYSHCTDSLWNIQKDPEGSHHRIIKRFGLEGISKII